VTHPLPPLVAERLRALRERPVEPTEKGFGLLASGLDGPAPARLAGSAPALYAAGFSYPMLTLRESALAGNLAAMAAYCAGAGVELAPHGKTAMSPELAARQLASGAWASPSRPSASCGPTGPSASPACCWPTSWSTRRASPGWRANSPPTPASPRTATWTAPTAWPSWTGCSPPARPGAGSRSWSRSAWGGPAAGPMTRRWRWPRRPPRPARSPWRAWPATKAASAAIPGSRPPARSRRSAGG